MGKRGTKQNSNQVRDLAANMAAVKALKTGPLKLEEELTVITSWTDSRGLVSLRSYLGRTTHCRAGKTSTSVHMRLFFGVLSH